MTFFALAPRPPRERDRQASLAVSGIDEDCAAEIGIHVRAAAQLFDTDIGLATIVTARRMVVIAGLGFDRDAIDRDVSFCSHVVAQPGRPICVLDAAADHRFAGNPLVMGDPRIRFYAGAALLSPDGMAVGALCAIDRSPRAAMSADQEAALTDLAERFARRLFAA